jgi:L-alanine-DL-glutamate epimerase-like enolase superfamily enzyme
VTRIAEIETILVRLRPRRVAVMRGQSAINQDRVLVRLRSDDGHVGWGEATAIPIWGGMSGRYYGETVETVSHVVHDVLAPLALGSDPHCPVPVTAGWDEAIIGHPYAKAALEMAIQDIRGKVLGESLANLLGGRFRDGARIAHMIGLMTEAEALHEADSAIERDGVTAFQVKGGDDPGRDAELIRKLRAALPSSTFLRLDANQGYGHEPKRAAEAVRRVAEAGVDAIEQPAATVEALASCTRAVAVPIIADEGCWQETDVLKLWQAGAADAVSVYVAKAGGIAKAAAVARVAAAVGFRCDVNGSLETGIGTAASIQVAESAANATLPSVIPVPGALTRCAGHYFEDDPVEGFSYEAGVLRLTGGPGLGVLVDEDALEHVTVPGSRRVSSTESAAAMPA